MKNLFFFVSELFISIFQSKPGGHIYVEKKQKRVDNRCLKKGDKVSLFFPQKIVQNILLFKTYQPLFIKSFYIKDFSIKCYYSGRRLMGSRLIGSFG
jgi:hypothetical protein